MTTVAVNTYTHSVTYVADNMLKSIKDIIRESGLDPANLVGSWQSKMLAMTTWLRSEHLVGITLEIYSSKTDALVGRWDMEVTYGWGSGEGHFWTDTEQIKYAIRKAGVAPSDAEYRVVLRTKPGEPHVAGWGDTTLRSTAGFVRQSLGSTVEHNGLGASTAYWRKAG